LDDVYLLHTRRFRRDRQKEFPGTYFLSHTRPIEALLANRYCPNCPPRPHFLRKAVTAYFCHATVVLSANYIAGSVAVMILVQIAICAYITLVANYTMERDLRRAYLFSLRDRLRHSRADSASNRDALTGLANRHHLDVELRRLWATASEPPTIVSVILMDIDHFKRLNDKYGHGAGDLCLKRMASILIAEVGAASEGVVRYGGEEFLMVLPQMQLVDAMRIAERIRRSVEKATIPNEGPGLFGIVTASFGVASASVGELTAAELIAVADTALYAAKHKGRNQVWPPLAAPSAASNIEQISFRDRAEFSPLQDQLPSLCNVALFPPGRLLPMQSEHS
jgi:diguanylate cyclase (GGDEF)-like protein